MARRYFYLDRCKSGKSPPPTINPSFSIFIRQSTTCHNVPTPKFVSVVTSKVVMCQSPSAVGRKNATFGSSNPGTWVVAWASAFPIVLTKFSGSMNVVQWYGLWNLVSFSQKFYQCLLLVWWDTLESWFESNLTPIKTSCSFRMKISWKAFLPITDLWRSKPWNFLRHFIFLILLSRWFHFFGVKKNNLARPDHTMTTSLPCFAVDDVLERFFVVPKKGLSSWVILQPTMVPCCSALWAFHSLAERSRNWLHHLGI